MPSSNRVLEDNEMLFPSECPCNRTSMADG
jgi:hypothetical protein